MGFRVGIVVRSARVERGWTQNELAGRLHCSRSTVSRIETGARGSVDADLLRHLARVLGISPATLGVTATVAAEPPAEDDVRRRQLLSNLAVTAAAAAVGTPAALAASARASATASHGADLAARLGAAMLGTGPAMPLIPADRLKAGLAAATGDYHACRYGRLADLLPRLLTSGQAAAGDGTAGILAEIYTLATRLLIKLDDELAWIAGDRAATIASACGRPLVAAEAARNLAVLARRAGRHAEATQIVLRAAGHDDLQGPAPALTAERGLLVMSAAYTAAHTGDQSGMRELTAQAGGLAGELPAGVVLRDHGGGFGHAAVALHLISAEFAAGDPSAAIAAARRVPPARLPTVERRARYYTDLARAYGMWGRREETLRALLAAERAAPEETHARPAVRDLVTGMLVSGRTTPELRGLAARCRIT